MYDIWILSESIISCVYMYIYRATTKRVIILHYHSFLCSLTMLYSCLSLRLLCSCMFLHSVCLPTLILHEIVYDIVKTPYFVYFMSYSYNICPVYYISNWYYCVSYLFSVIMSYSPVSLNKVKCVCFGV